MNFKALTCQLSNKVSLGVAAESSKSIEVQRRNIDDWLSQLLTKIMLAGNRRIMLELRSNMFSLFIAN